MVFSGVLPPEPKITFTPHPELRLIGFLHSLFGLLGSRGELGEVLRRFIRDIAEYLEADGAYVLSTQETDNLPILAEYGVPFEEETHDPAVISSFYDELIRKQQPALASGSTTIAASLIGVPMLTEKRLVGILIFFRNVALPPFLPEDIPLLSVIAQPLAIHLENVDFARVNAVRRAEVEAILASMEDGLLVVDRLGQVISFNNALARLAAYTLPELYSLSWTDLVSTDPRYEYVFEGFSQCLREREPYHGRCAGVMKRGDGLDVSISVVFNTMDEVPGMVTGGVISIRDVTIEAQIDRMKDEFIANVSHELKTPITTISGFLQMMISREMTRPEQLPLLVVLKEETERLNRLVNDVLDLSRIQANRIKIFPRRFRLETLLRKCIRPLAVRSQDTHRILLTVKPNLGMIFADYDRLMQVIINLVSNAVKYSPLGGDVVVRAIRKADWWTIAVQDHGIGIPHDAMQHLFTRFYRINENQTAGSGLGLFITKEIVERHRGRLEVQSEVGEGSLFTVTLPTYVGPEPGSGDEVPSPKRRSRRPLKDFTAN